MGKTKARWAEKGKMGRTREERKGQTRSASLTRWSDSHVLLAVHDETPHRLAIWIVGSSLTYCGWKRRRGGREQSGQLVLLIKAQWPRRDHLLAGARTGSRRCLSTSFCSTSLQRTLHRKPPVDFNTSKRSNKDCTGSLASESYTRTCVYDESCTIWKSWGLFFIDRLNNKPM